MKLEEISAAVRAMTAWTIRDYERGCDEKPLGYEILDADGECVACDEQYYPTAPDKKQAMEIVLARTLLPKLLAVAEAFKQDWTTYPAIDAPLAIAALKDLEADP